jgi:hypothetical protein
MLEQLDGYKTHILVGLYVALVAYAGFQDASLMDFETLKEFVAAGIVSAFRSGMAKVTA